MPGDGQVMVSDRDLDAPPGQRYAVLGFDPDTTERYWRSRPNGERNRLVKAAAKDHGANCRVTDRCRDFENHRIVILHGGSFDF